MAINTTNDDLKDLIYDFFYKFSRFEFALKNSGYIDSYPTGGIKPDWNKFCNEYKDKYELTVANRELLAAPPKTQTLREGKIVWSDLTFKPDLSELSKIVLAIKTIRNNLFHGGKHGHRDWNDTRRVRFVLMMGTQCLDDLASSNYDLLCLYRGK